jgi:hypothetical protein
MVYKVLVFLLEPIYELDEGLKMADWILLFKLTLDIYEEGLVMRALEA